MTFEFRLPDLGEGVAQGEVIEWHVKPGDVVREDQPLVRVLTDKANVEIPCPVNGQVLTLNARVGEMVKVGGLLVTIEAEGGRAVPQTTRVEESHPSPPLHHSASPATPNERVLATPSVRRKAAELGVNLKEVLGTGPSGRITDSDLERHLPGHGRSSGTAIPAISSPTPGIVPSSPPTERKSLEERVPLLGLRRVIAERMALSKQKAAHFTYVEEIDVSELVRVRERAKRRLEEQGVALTYLPFILKSAVEGLKDHPRLNALMDDEKRELVVCHYYNIGIATETPEGLIVSVIKEADRKSIATLAREVQGLSERGKAGKLTREELTGSTFTITSLGALGGLFATPILNYPEVAILGVHKIARRPVVLPDGSIGVAHMMNLSLSLDHRVNDGYVGAQFLASIKSHLEDPHQLLMELR